MGNLKNILSGLLPKEKSQWKVFLTCLGISTILWGLLTFSEERNDDLDVDLNFINFPLKEIRISEIPKSISVTIKAQGFELISKSFGFRNPTVDIDLSKTKILKRNNEIHYYWLPSRHAVELEEATGLKLKGGKVTSKTDTVKVVFSAVVEKDLITCFDYKVSKAKDYFVLKEPLLSPYKVTVRGAKSVLNNLDSIYTEQVIIDLIDADLDQDYNLLKPFGVDSIFNDSVRVFMGVEALKEHEFMIPISILDAPDSLEFKLFPSEVKVTFTCGMSDLVMFTADDFVARVNFEDIKSSFRKLNVELFKTPDIVKKIKIEPASIEYIVKSID